jgi:hypothetical protein
MLIPVSNELKAGHMGGCLENHHLPSHFGQMEELNPPQVLAMSVKSGLISQRQQRVAFASWTRQADRMGRINDRLVGGNCGILCPVMAMRLVCDAWGLQHQEEGEETTVVNGKNPSSKQRNRQMTFPA